MINIKKQLKTDQERGEESKRMEEEVTDLPHSTVSSSYEEKTKNKKERYSHVTGSTHYKHLIYTKIYLFKGTVKQNRFYFRLLF